MPWSGGTYTKWNNATGGWTGDATAGTGIEAGRHDSQDSDFTTGISSCLNKDGSNAATGNLNIGNFKLTNLGSGSASTDSVTFGQVTGGLDVINTATAVNFTRCSADASGPQLVLRKNRSATTAGNTIAAASDQTGAIIFQGANGTGYTSSAAIIGAVDGTPGASNDMPGMLLFYTTADGSGSLTERMRIANTGNIGIGTSPSAVSRIYVQSSTATSASFALALLNSASADLFNVRGDGLINMGLAAASPYNTTTALATNATLLSTGVLARSTSSLKYKTDIADATHGLAEVLQLRPVTYRGKNDGINVFGGLIAEEVDAIGLSEFVVYDDNGNPDALAYGNLVSLAFKAIQQLNTKVEALEARIAELEA